MARVDDVVFNYLHLSRNAVQNDCIKGALEDAVRYGFQQGESFGRYVKYVDDKMNCEVFQEAEPKKLQKVVRTAYELEPMGLEKALNEGWTVAHVNPIGGGYTLEYILEKTENLGNSKAVKNPEE